ncbi:MAG: DUF1214 domain-containing protein [Myxococcota bacterium]
MHASASRSPLRRTRALVAAFACALAIGLAPGARADDPAGADRFRELESVKAFDELLATLGGMRDMILEDSADAREASEGMRFLLRVVAMSQEVTGDGYPLAPHFARMDTPRRKIGGDNPDAEYDNLMWSGDVDYRITGNRGTVDHLSFTVLVREPSGRSRSIGYVNERGLGVDDDGSFTLWLTKEKPKEPGYWVRTEPGQVGSMLVRQYIGDRASERLATYEIEAVGRERFDPLPPSTDAEVAASIRGTLLAMNGLGRLHRYVSPSLADPPNRLGLRNSDDFGADISSTDNLYVIGTYGFGPDEALLIELTPLEVRYWNFAIESPWHESVDYMQRKTSRTHDDVVLDPDGKLRFVVAHARTDHPNYLETAGHARGFMTFRWVGERDTKPPLPTVRKLPLAEAVRLANELGGR